VGATAEGVGAEDWDLDKLWTSLKQLYPVTLTVDDLVGEAGGEEGLSPELLEERLKDDAHAAYDAREEELGPEAVRELERQVLLAVIDRKWREHLYEMDYLQEGVGLRAYAQRDPLVEYQREGFDMFQQMLDGIKEEAVAFLFNLEVQVEAAEAAAEEPQVEIHAKGLGAQRLPRNLQYTAPTIDGAAGSGGVSIEKEQSAPALGVGSDNGRSQPRGRGGARPARAPRPTPGTKQLSGTATAGGGPRSALGIDGEDAPPARAGATAGGARRSGPASPTAAGARKPSPGQATAAGGPSRNAPCYCGSGKKYKRCHGAPGAA
jgi:preprotein translocase subunit SecA